jgi:hypothetical protein
MWDHYFVEDGVNDTSYPMMIAYGPNRPLNSDAEDAPLKRHSTYGTFTMNMAQAVGKGQVPEMEFVSKGVRIDYPLIKDYDSANWAHAVLGAVAIFVLWPLNVAAAGFLKKRGVRVGVSVLLLATLVFSYGLGMSVSYQYKRVSLPIPLSLSSLRPNSPGITAPLTRSSPS